MHSLPLFLKLAGRQVIVLGDSEIVAAKRRLLERAGAEISVDENAPATLAIVAFEDGDAAREATSRLRARGILVNAVDRPELCDFTLPAIVDRAPVIIAIGTGGASAGLAKALRQRLEALLPQSLGALADALKAARPRIRARWPQAADRRRAIDAVLAEDEILDPFSDPNDDAVNQWLDAGDAIDRPARIERVDISSDDPDDLTLRAARLLGQADAVFHETGISSAILDRARADAARCPCSGTPEWNGPGLALWLRRKVV